LATEADDAEIRRLFRENPMAGQISISLEREPSYFAEGRIVARETSKPVSSNVTPLINTPLPGGEPARDLHGNRFNGFHDRQENAGVVHVSRHVEDTPLKRGVNESGSEISRGIPGPAAEWQTIVAREGGRIVCVGSCSIRWRFVNGELRRVGYLGGLRLDSKVAGRFDILRRGYRFFRELQKPGGPERYFTAIAADNERAIRFLERGLPGMPFYEYLSDFLTVLVPVRQCGSWRARKTRKNCVNAEIASAEDGRTTTEIIERVNEQNRGYQFAPCWRAEELLALDGLGLSMNDFRVVRGEAGVVACAALWDQRWFKQTVIRGYAWPLSAVRPWINLAAPLLRWPRLPASGTTLAHATVSHLAAQPNQPEALVTLVEELFCLAAEKGIEFLTFGFAAGDPRLVTIRASFACREYRSRLYSVRWAGTQSGAIAGSLPYPELALL